MVYVLTNVFSLMVAGAGGGEGLLPPAVPGHRGQHQARVRPAGAIRSTEQGSSMFCFVLDTCSHKKYSLIDFDKKKV